MSMVKVGAPLIMSTKEVPEASISLFYWPEDCLHEVMSHFSQVDLARSSCVSTTWKRLAASHTSWEALLPLAYHRNNQKVYSSPFTPLKLYSCHTTASKCYEALRRGLFLQNGRQFLTVHPKSGVLRISVSVARAMEITWSRHRLRSEEWANTAIEHPASPFVRAGELAVLFWLKLQCKTTCLLAPGKWKVSWRLGRECLPEDELDGTSGYSSQDTFFNEGSNSPTVNDWRYKTPPRAGRMGLPFALLEVPATSKFSVANSPPMISSVDISQESIDVIPVWTEVQVAEFDVICADGEELAKVNFEAELIDTRRRKVAVYADSLVFEMISDEVDRKRRKHDF